MENIKAIVVFCGSNEGNHPIFMEQAEKLGAILAQNNIKLIYGAGGKGLMGAVAKGASQNDGFIVGATIQPLYEIEQSDLQSLSLNKFEVWDKMSNRKVSMTRQTDAVCILPGGLGTLDELFEILVLRQLQITTHPIIVVNLNGFYNTLQKMLQEMSDAGFIKPHLLKLLHFVDTVEDVLPAIQIELAQKDA